MLILDRRSPGLRDGFRGARAHECCVLVDQCEPGDDEGTDALGYIAIAPARSHRRWLTVEATG